MLTIEKLLWDSWNRAHIARHKVTVDEVEEICQSDPVVQQGKKGRLLIYGITNNGRVLTIVLDPEEKIGVYYPVTAHISSKKERRIYKFEKGGDKND